MPESLTCNYCNALNHVIEDCPVLLAKVQEIRGGNAQIQKISAEVREEDPRVAVVTRGGATTGEDRITPGKNPDIPFLRRAPEKAPMFDPRQEKQTFEEARREFEVGQPSSSESSREVKECDMPPAFDRSVPARQGKEVSKLIDFLHSCMGLITDDNAIQELQHLIKQYAVGKVEPLLTRAVNKVSRKKRSAKELHLSAQIGDYDMDYVVLDLGSEVNVMTKQTWTLMGKPRFIYSPIRLRMANQRAVSPYGKLEHVPIDIDGVKTFADFEVIEIVDDSCPYPALLGIDWAFDNLAVLDRMFEAGITFPVEESEWISPMVIQNNNTGESRICVDLRSLNAACIHDPFPKPFKDEVLENAGGKETSSFTDGQGTTKLGL